MEERRCSQCGKWEGISLEVSYIPVRNRCEKCGYYKDVEWKFSFCDAKCFSKWFVENDVAKKGIPCRDCNKTGWKGGFESNGVCRTCNGKKSVTEAVIVEV